MIHSTIFVRVSRSVNSLLRKVDLLFLLLSLVRYLARLKAVSMGLPVAETSILDQIYGEVILYFMPFMFDCLR
jgi:hypothetical protein